MTKHIARPTVFEMRIETHYAQPVSSSDSEFGTLLQRLKEKTYEQFPENHTRFQAFLGISQMLQDAAAKYDGQWTMENVRKEVAKKGPFDKVDHKAHLDGAYADFLYQVGTLTSTIAAATALLKVMQPSLVQWLKNRGPRTIRMKIGTSEVSVQGEEDISKVFELLKSADSDNAKKRKPASKTRKSHSRKIKKQTAPSKTRARRSRTS